MVLVTFPMVYVRRQFLIGVATQNRVDWRKSHHTLINMIKDESLQANRKYGKVYDVKLSNCK